MNIFVQYLLVAISVFVIFTLIASYMNGSFSF